MRIERSQTLAKVSRHEIVPLELAPEAARYADQSRASSTRRAYLTDTTRFASWCATRGLTSIPASPETVANFLSFLARDFKVATIERNLAAISVGHRKLGFESPRRYEIVREVMRGIRRDLGVAPIKKAPVLVGDLRALVKTTKAAGIKGARDRALMVLGFAGAFRRSELVALDVSDLAFTGEGLEITLRRSKADQEGAGAKIGIPYGSYPQTCPVRVTKAWLDAACIGEGPLFRPVNRHGQVAIRRLSGKAVASVLKVLAANIGLDPTKLGAHSLRAGLVTSAIRSGKQERLVMRQTRHKSVAVFRGYVRDADLFSENAAAGIGL